MEKIREEMPWKRLLTPWGKKRGGETWLPWLFLGLLRALFTLHCTTLHYNALYLTALHCTTLHYTSLHYTALHCCSALTALHHAVLHHTALHHTTLHHTALHLYELHYTALHHTALHHTALHHTALHHTALHHTAQSRLLGSFLWWPGRSLARWSGPVGQCTSGSYGPSWYAAGQWTPTIVLVSRNQNFGYERGP